MNLKHNKCASEASSSKLLCKEAATGDQKGRSDHASGGELVRNGLASGFKSDPSCDPSVIRETAAQQVPREALLKLAYVLKEAHEQMRREGYVIINGKLTKTPVDSAKIRKSGMMAPLSDSHIDL